MDDGDENVIGEKSQNLINCNTVTQVNTNQIYSTSKHDYNYNSSLCNLTNPGKFDIN